MANQSHLGACGAPLQYVLRVCVCVCVCVRARMQHHSCTALTLYLSRTAAFDGARSAALNLFRAAPDGKIAMHNMQAVWGM